MREFDSYADPLRNKNGYNISLHEVVGDKRVRSEYKIHEKLVSK